MFNTVTLSVEFSSVRTGRQLADTTCEADLFYTERRQARQTGYFASNHDFV